MRVTVSAIATFMLWIVLLALDMAAMRTASELGARAMVFLTGVVLLTALPAAAYTRRARRAFWLGFALFGWSYGLVVFSHLNSELRDSLLTSRLLDEYYPKVHPLSRRLADSIEVWDRSARGYVAMSAQITWREYDRFSYQRAGHALSTTLFALLGGVLVRVVRAVSEPREDRAAGVTS